MWKGEVFKMKECVRCNSTEQVNKHHVFGSGKGEHIFLCQTCHDEIHGIERKEDVKSLERRIRRAKKRIKRDNRIIEETRKKLKIIT